MTVPTGLALVRRNITRSRRHFLFSSVGLVVGTATLAFFLALSTGIRDKVLNRLYPVNQAEFQVETVSVFGLGIEVPVRLDEAALTALSGLPGVRNVYPKQRSRFQAKLWGGQEVIGHQARVEAFFDGIGPDLIRDELRQTEKEVLGPESAGGDCGDRGCRRPTYWDSFRDLGGLVACGGDGDCPAGQTCLLGLCRTACGAASPCGSGLRCVGEVCAVPCEGKGACDPGETCTPVGEGSVCRRLACRLDHPRVQFSPDWEALRGTLVERPGACPVGTYCAIPNILERDGFCEAPIPVILSPFLLEVYNRVAATALGLRRLSGLEVMLGIRSAMLFGESYFVADEAVDRRVVRRSRVVGFSPKAMTFGVTMPIAYVERANAMLRGRDAASDYTGVIVETERNEDIPSLVEDARILGLTLAPSSEEGRKAANVLLILTLVFAMVSLVILGISAINITHTFLMLVTERRTEIAVYRAVGATLLEIRALVLAEAAWLGLVGGILGLASSWLVSRLANLLAGDVLARVPGSPADLFVFSPLVFGIGMGCAVLFSLVGAYLPARTAARTDPATVLSQG